VAVCCPYSVRLFDVLAGLRASEGIVALGPVVGVVCVWLGGGGGLLVGPLGGCMCDYFFCLGRRGGVGVLEASAVTPFRDGDCDSRVPRISFFVCMAVRVGLGSVGSLSLLRGGVCFGWGGVVCFCNGT